MAWELDAEGAVERHGYRGCALLVGLPFATATAALAADGGREPGLLAVFAGLLALSVSLFLARVERRVEFAPARHRQRLRLGPWTVRGAEVSLEAVERVALTHGVDHPNVPRMRWEWVLVTLEGEGVELRLAELGAASAARAEQLAEHLARGLGKPLVVTRP